jgi:hypothetical protein
LIDGRELLPPEPLELTLAALDGLGDADELLLKVNCRPVPLFGILRRHGYEWQESVQADGSVEVVIRRARLA